MSEHNGQLPNSKKTYVSGRLHPDIRVPVREISLAPTKSINGEIEINEPVHVYDTSGPWGDPDFHGDVTQGLPPLRAKWIRERGDIEEINGRAASPRDDGYLSEVHRASANGNDGGKKDSKFKKSKLRSQPEPFVHRLVIAVTQLGVCTPGHHHAGNGIHRDPRKSRTRSAHIKHSKRLAERLRTYCPQRPSPNSIEAKVFGAKIPH